MRFNVSPCRSGTVCCQAAGFSLPDFEVFFRAIEGTLCQNCCAEELWTYPAGNFSSYARSPAWWWRKTKDHIRENSFFRNHFRENEIDQFALEVMLLMADSQRLRFRSSNIPALTARHFPVVQVSGVWHPRFPTTLSSLPKQLSPNDS